MKELLVNAGMNLLIIAILIVGAAMLFHFSYSVFFPPRDELSCDVLYSSDLQKSYSNNLCIEIEFLALKNGAENWLFQIPTALEKKNNLRLNKVTIRNLGKNELKEANVKLLIKPVQGFIAESKNYGDFLFKIPDLQPGETRIYKHDGFNELREISTNELLIRHWNIELDQAGDWLISFEEFPYGGWPIINGKSGTARLVEVLSDQEIDQRMKSLGFQYLTIVVSLASLLFVAIQLKRERKASEKTLESLDKIVEKQNTQTKEVLKFLSKKPKRKYKKRGSKKRKKKQSKKKSNL